MNVVKSEYPAKIVSYIGMAVLCMQPTGGRHYHWRIVHRMGYVSASDSVIHVSDLHQ